MKSQLDYTLTINRPTAYVFQWLTDFSKWSLWARGLRQMQPETAGPLEVGSRIREYWRGAGPDQYQVWEITEFVPERLMKMESSAPVASASSAFTLDSIGEATSLTVQSEVRTAGMLWIINLIFKLTAKGQLDKFKRLVENS